MTYIKREKLFSAEWFKNYSFIVLGSFILAVGYVFFITPYKIVPGGVLGISIVIHYMTEGVFKFAPAGLPVGMMGFIMNIPLTIIGVKILGPRFGIKTILGFFLTSGFIDLLTWIWGNDPLVTGDALLSSIFGGVLIGSGLGLIFKSRATSGGSDIIAMIISKYTKITPGQLLIYIDSIIVLVGLIAFRDWRVPLYSWIVIFITGKVLDAILTGANYDKSLFIITDKYDEIRDRIINDLNRSGTLIRGTGLYRESEKKIIFTTVNRRELVMLESYIKEIDQNAFMTVFDAREVLGEGFKPLKEVEY
jgi:uncharacterized membrane-anchored protein YitT (DUF2179 family)